ncbi:NB-ARC domain-containing protein [Okeania sp. SIO2B3]|uniref:NB-ARC domain-containing protein n=1 Tax=Okeania sp. SIO2B3 TaxID=2607784 RepID=UPI0013C0C86A|nr:NB-ARC domain-containing protein [Okeania sp. SIO2B3]NET41695.1 NACHT domain-containing protein [Okeania sp. SIO2B3]
MSQLPQEFLKQLTTEATKVKLSEEEHRTLIVALEGLSIKEIAEREDISEVAIQKRLGKIYKKFGITSTGPGKLMELKYLLESKYQSQTGVKQEFKTEDKYYSLEEAPRPTNFYGREEQLKKLEKWIIKDKCQLLAILGKGGIGKTALSVQLIERIKNNFDYVIWRSLRNAPDFIKIVGDLIDILSGKSTTYSKGENESTTQLEPEKREKIENEMISTLMKYLRERRCLIIFDNLETILKVNEFVGHYQDKYKGYGRLLIGLGEQKHQSCILITSREKPREIALLAQEEIEDEEIEDEEIQPVRSLQLGGLREPAKKILEAKKLSGEDMWKPLIKLYEGNPLGLKLISTTIQQLYGGDVSEFLNQTLTYVVRGFGDMIKEQFKRMTPLEKEIVYWLALESRLSIENLKKKFISPPRQIGDILNALQSLNDRYMIEKEGADWNLQDTIRECVLHQFVKQICQEIIDYETMENIKLIRSHKFTYSNNTKKNEINSPLKLIENKLYSLEYFRSPKEVIERLQEIQKILEGKSQLEIGYADENVRELLEEFQRK